ncbi:MAG: hypothetical protein MI748_13430 [Opitutales bacterium]|nr:hypothetical protein [Opitutales bacterium]
MIQLNVRNVFYDAKLIPVSTNPDGSVAAWRIPQPRTVEFSAAFEF